MIRGAVKLRTFWTLRINGFFSPDGVENKMVHNSSAQAQTLYLYFMIWRHQAICFWKSSGAGAPFIPSACTLCSYCSKADRHPGAKLGCPCSAITMVSWLLKSYIIRILYKVILCTWQRKPEMDIMDPLKIVYNLFKCWRNQLLASFLFTQQSRDRTTAKHMVPLPSLKTRQGFVSIILKHSWDLGSLRQRYIGGIAL